MDAFRRAGVRESCADALERSDSGALLRGQRLSGKRSSRLVGLEWAGMGIDPVRSARRTAPCLRRIDQRERREFRHGHRYWDRSCDPYYPDRLSSARTGGEPEWKTGVRPWIAEQLE